jgi:hypothetical protein
LGRNQNILGGVIQVKERLAKVLEIVERLEQDLSSLREHIVQLLEERPPKQIRKQKAHKSVENFPPPEEMRSVWRQLREEYEKGNQEAIHKFVEEHTKPFLRAFAHANNLPIDFKRSKKEIAKEILELLRVEIAISRKAFTISPDEIGRK